MPTVTLDSYSETNQDSNGVMYSGATAGIGQSFNASATAVLNSCKFYMKKNNSPTGNAEVRIYAHTGTYGSGGTPTGAVLATSETFDVATLTTSYQLITFTFSGSNRIELTSGTKYFLTIFYTGGDINNQVWIGEDNSSPTHGGNLANYSGSWTAQNSFDACFYVYANTPETISVSETINVSESITPVKIKIFSLTDTINVSEIYSQIKAKTFSIIDTINVSEIKIATIVKKFSNMAKSVVNWVNQSKNQ